MTAIELLWPDGSVTTGKNWTEVEDAIRASQWSTYKDRKEFRRELQHRALLWSGTKVHVGGSSRAFLRELADAQMFMIVSGGD